MQLPKGFLGIVCIVLGIFALLTVIGIGLMLIGPLILFAIGVILYRKGHKLSGIILILIGCVALVNNLFHINTGGLIVAALLIYIGYRILSKNKKEEFQQKEPLFTDPKADWTVEEETQNRNDRYQHHTYTSSSVKNSLIGDLHLMHHQFELEDMNIWHGIGDVKIDLSRAIIPDGETVLIINGWIGDIDIYVPYDLDVCINASVTIGGLNIMNRKETGFQRHISTSSQDYKQSTKRVKIILSLLIGDIDVRVL